MMFERGLDKESICCSDSIWGGIVKDFSDVEYLIKQLISGNEEAWSYFLKHYGRLIHYCIKNIMGNHFSQEDRDDCYEEILKVLIERDYKRLKQIRYMDKKAFCSWLGILTKRRTLNFIRGIRESYPLPDEFLSIMPDSSDPPDQEALRSQIMDIINWKLNDQERLVMFYILEGLTLEEIAKLMGFKLGTVFNIKKKAISDLKGFIGQDKKIFR